jgi:hypothetical protein
MACLKAVSGVALKRHRPPQTFCSDGQEGRPWLEFEPGRLQMKSLPLGCIHTQVSTHSGRSIRFSSVLLRSTLSHQRHTAK